MDDTAVQLRNCMYQYSRAIYRSIKDLIDPYVPPDVHLEYRRQVLEACESTMERLATDPLYFAKLPCRRRSRGRCRKASRQPSASSRIRSRPVRSTAASRAAGRRRAKASLASARRSRSATTARRTSTWSVRPRARRARSLQQLRKGLRPARRMRGSPLRRRTIPRYRHCEGPKRAARASARAWPGHNNVIHRKSTVTFTAGAR